MGKRPKPNDVLEVATKNGKIYLHYLGRHDEYGDAILVCPAILNRRPTIDKALFEDAYAVFYPAAAATASGVATVVGQIPSPGVPKRLRRPGAMEGTRVKTWIIEDGQSETVKRKLSSTERQLPIAEIWNHEFLVEKVLDDFLSTNKMKPESDESPKSAKPETQGTGQVLSHYLYFPNQRGASRCAAELRRRGFDTEVRLGADASSWLLLARQTIAPSDQALAALRASLEALAGRLGGEYDGWEVEYG